MNTICILQKTEHINYGKKFQNLCEGYGLNKEFTTVFVHMQMEFNWRRGKREGKSARAFTQVISKRDGKRGEENERERDRERKRESKRERG